MNILIKSHDTSPSLLSTSLSKGWSKFFWWVCARLVLNSGKVKWFSSSAQCLASHNVSRLGLAVISSHQLLVGGFSGQCVMCTHQLAHTAFGQATQKTSVAGPKSEFLSQALELASACLAAVKFPLSTSYRF